jgi:hypothetical protein
MSVFEILRKRFPENEYALMAEVRDKAGFDASRSADYIAVNLWPSRGLSVNGIELKSFRSDWLSELRKPEKAEKIFQYCDYFWKFVRCLLDFKTDTFLKLLGDELYGPM